MKIEENRGVVTNFSIDHILHRAGQETCVSMPSRERPAPQQSVGSRPPHSRDSFPSEELQNFTFHWLSCSRYRPPKLPRGQKREGLKRQPGRHPRIPFTPMQIETLELSYSNSQYLCPDEVIRLSQLLDLSDTRIKIWFQNRRAREKREKDAKFNTKPNFTCGDEEYKPICTTTNINN